MQGTTRTFCEAIACRYCNKQKLLKHHNASKVDKPNKVVLTNVSLTHNIDAIRLSVIFVVQVVTSYDMMCLDVSNSDQRIFICGIV